MHNYYIYILINSFGNIMYVGMTNDLIRRIFEHKSGLIPGFTQTYKVSKLVYYEHTHSVEAAIAREKQIKGWTRAKKLALIAQTNPEFKDLAAQYGWRMLHPQQNIADQK